MNTRMRSPNYPATSLRQAVEIVGKLYASERSNATDRGVAVLAMGYSGVTGTSAKVLSDLSQYGLIEKAGKSEVRVTARAVDILHPDNSAQKVAALRAAVKEPELFQRITDRFPDGRPSEAALKSFLTREGFTDAAIPSARKAYADTFAFVEYEIGNESNGPTAPDDPESTSNQYVDVETPVQNQEVAPVARRPANSAPVASQVTYQEWKASKPSFRWAENKIWLDGGVIATQADADEVVNFINALRGMLKPVEPSPILTVTPDREDPKE